MARFRDTPTSRRRGLIIAGAVVAVLAIAGAGVSLSTLLTPTHHDPAAGDGGSRPSTSSSPTVRTVVDGGSLCGLPGLDPAGTTLNVAPTATWATVGLMAAPASKTAGPGKTQPDGLRWCYAHTATGALFAATNNWAIGSDPRLTLEQLRQNVATGPGRNAALAQTHSPANNGLTAQIDAFRIATYSPSAATVDVVFLLSDGRQISAPTPLVWQDGDWKVQLSSTGEDVFPLAVLTSLDGYIPWAGTP